MFQQIVTMFSAPHKVATVKLNNLIRAQARLLVHSALVETGVAGLLSQPRSFEDISAVIAPEHPDLLRSLLDLGVGLGDLSRKKGRYVARSAVARALAEPEGDAVASCIQEVAQYHGDVLRTLPARIAGEPAAGYLADYGQLVARSSRIVEPFLGAFAQEVAGRDKARRILEIGCGTGAYLRHYATAHRGHHGLAIDLDPAVVELARTNLGRWGLSDRFDVVQQDIRTPTGAVDGPFDLVTSYQNVYYFSSQERIEWFGQVRSRLGPGGVFAIASALRDDGFMGTYFDIILASTAGCHPLPTIGALEREVRAAGFGQVEPRRLMIGSSFWGIVAR